MVGFQRCSTIRVSNGRVPFQKFERALILKNLELRTKHRVCKGCRHATKKNIKIPFLYQKKSSITFKVGFIVDKTCSCHPNIERAKKTSFHFAHSSVIFITRTIISTVDKIYINVVFVPERVIFIKNVCWRS